MIAAVTMMTIKTYYDYYQITISTKKKKSNVLHPRGRGHLQRVSDTPGGARTSSGFCVQGLDYYHNYQSLLWLL